MADLQRVNVAVLGITLPASSLAVKASATLSSYKEIRPGPPQNSALAGGGGHPQRARR